MDAAFDFGQGIKQPGKFSLLPEMRTAGFQTGRGAFVVAAACIRVLAVLTDCLERPSGESAKGETGP